MPPVNVRRATSFAFALVILLCTAACGVKVKVNPTSRSGTAGDDYVEEPISVSSAKYAHALEVSNKAMELIKAGEWHELYTNYLAGEIRHTVFEADFIQGMTEPNKYGAIREFKPQQWSFAVKENRGRTFLVSTKIVEHEKHRVLYVFLFEDDGKYEKLVGVQWKPYIGVHTPGL